MTGLEELLLCDNNLPAVPVAVCGCVSLKRLNLSGNALSQLPNAIGDLVNLESLTLSRNNIASLPVRRCSYCAFTTHVMRYSRRLAN